MLKQIPADDSRVRFFTGGVKRKITRSEELEINDGVFEESACGRLVGKNNVAESGMTDSFFVRAIFCAFFAFGARMYGSWC